MSEENARAVQNLAQRCVPDGWKKDNCLPGFLAPNFLHHCDNCLPNNLGTALQKSHGSVNAQNFLPFPKNLWEIKRKALRNITSSWFDKASFSFKRLCIYWAQTTNDFNDMLFFKKKKFFSHTLLSNQRNCGFSSLQSCQFPSPTSPLAQPLKARLTTKLLSSCYKQITEAGRMCRTCLPSSSQKWIRLKFQPSSSPAGSFWAQPCHPFSDLRVVTAPLFLTPFLVWSLRHCSSVLPDEGYKHRWPDVRTSLLFCCNHRPDSILRE